jgi:ATP-dependent RNA helicase SUPV3L1/SUV3
VHNGRPGMARLSKRFLAKVIEMDPALPASFYAAIGLRVLKGLALRPDRLERLASAARRLSRSGPLIAGDELAALLNVEQPALRRLFSALGYRVVFRAGEELFIGGRRGRRHAVKSRSQQSTAEGHPFAKLRELNLT